MIPRSSGLCLWVPHRGGATLLPSWDGNNVKLRWRGVSRDRHGPAPVVRDGWRGGCPVARGLEARSGTGTGMAPGARP